MRLATLPGELARRGFDQPEAAGRQVSELGELIGEDTAISLDLLADAADPDQALETLIRLARRDVELVRAIATDEGWSRRLVAVLGASLALSQHILAHPSDVELLHPEPVRRVAAEIVADIAAAVGVDVADGFDLGGRAATLPDAADRLRLENRRQILRIAARDLARDDPWDFETISAELADLADAVLRGALAVARAEVPDHDDARLAVIALGKCGARELNYISDIDVLYVAEPARDDVPTDRAMKIATKLAAAMTRACSAHTAAGTIWQVDAALRPEGKAGPLVRTMASMAKYYDTWAKNWEFQAMLKARPAAGDQELGREFCQLVADRVWRAAQSEGFITDSQAMRQRVIDNIPRQEADREIKLGQGGLRDIEFSVQLLELVHGRADERLREPATMPGLRALVDNGYIGRADGAEMARCYRFMRTLEHRVQLFRMRRTHLFPDDPSELRRLAHGVGSSSTELVDRWRAIRRSVHRLQRRVFFSPLLEAVARLSTDQLRLSTDAARARLRALGFLDPDAALRNIGALTQGVTRSAEIQRQLLPAMMGWFADGPNPDHGLLSFRRISDALSDSPWYLRALRDEGAVAQRLAQVLSSSRLVVELLLRNPSSVRLLLDPAELRPRDRADLVRKMGVLIGRHADAAEAIAAVRAVRGRELLRLALGDIVGQIDPDALGGGLADLTSATLEAALAIAEREVDGGQTAGGIPRIGVVAMGRWGGRESGYGSDADAMFVVADSDPDEVKRSASAIALARKLLAAPGPDPALEIDPDLRPEGRGGPMVRSLDSYAAYYERWSSTWEAQALVRASFGAGDPDLVGRLMTIIEPRRYPPDGVTAQQVAEIRKLKVRVEKERMPRRSDPTRNLKLGPGGLSDVEWTVQLMQLRHAGAHPELRVTSTMAVLAAARDLGLVGAEDAGALEDAWRMASRIRNTVVLVRGRGADAIPSDARDVAAVASLMGYRRAEASKLIDDYLRCARRASRVVDRLFWEG